MLQVKNLSFSYKTQVVLKDINFKVEVGEHVSVIGESGSGKSTLLKLLYGTYDLNEGEIIWKNKPILGPKFNLIIGPKYMKYVAQEFDLMPYTSVAENIGTFLSNFYPEEKKQRTEELLEVVELTAFANTKVKLLSGGQKQRVAIAKAIAKQPEILLLDEPFSHIDNFKKQTLRRSLFKYLKQKNITCIVATHDREDVLGFSDRMLLINNHSIEANDSPESLYKNPKTTLMASFFDEYNLIENKIVYPYQLHVVKESNIKATVINSYFKGRYYLIEANYNNSNIFFQHASSLEIGKNVCLKIMC